jgi:hypothetical protein
VKRLNAEDRHEIYEPLWLTAEAKPEHIARRDSFWSGVVLYREKRWAEAYAEFQKARVRMGRKILHCNSICAGWRRLPALDGNPRTKSAKDGFAVATALF